MTESPDFIDYYSILQVSPSCDVKTLELAYHRLASDMILITQEALTLRNSMN